MFDLDPGSDGRKTSVAISYYHAQGADIVATSRYELFETIVIAKDRPNKMPDTKP